MSHFLFHGCEELVRQALDMRMVVLHLSLGQTAGLTKTYDKTRGESSRPHTFLLSTAADLRMDSDSRLLAHIQGTNAFRSIQLVSTDRQQIDVHLVDVDRNFADTLRSIRVEEYFVVTADLSNLLQWLCRADFIIDMDDGADKCVRPDGLLQDLQVDETLSRDRQVSHLEPFIFEFSAGVEHALMIDLSGDNVALFITVEACETLQAEIVRFSCATSEDDLLAGGTDEVSNMLSCVFACLLAFPAIWMGA